MAVFALVKHNQQQAELESMELSDIRTHDWEDEEEVDLSEFGLLDDDLDYEEQTVEEAAQRQPSNQSSAPVSKLFKTGIYNLIDGDIDLCGKGGLFSIDQENLNLGDKHGIDIVAHPKTTDPDPGDNNCNYVSQNEVLDQESFSKFTFKENRICGAGVIKSDLKLEVTVHKDGQIMLVYEEKKEDPMTYRCHWQIKAKTAQ